MKIEELPHIWTSAERIRVAVHMLGMIQLDVSAGRYGEAGRPNITSVLYVLQADGEILERYRAELAAALDESPPPPPAAPPATNCSPRGDPLRGLWSTRG